MSETAPAEITETWKQQALRLTISRHEGRIREAAESIKRNADRILADLDAGRTPDSRSLVPDAQLIATRAEILEALRDVGAIFRSADA